MKYKVTRKLPLSKGGRVTKDQVIVINLSGRGDKDCQEVARLLDDQKT